VKCHDSAIIDEVRWFVILGLAAGCSNEAAVPDAAHYAGSGAIQLRSYTSEPGTGAGTSAVAEFIAREDCGTTQVGPCSIRSCAPDWLGLTVSAGDLTVDSTPAWSIPPGAPDQTRSVWYFARSAQPAFGPGDGRTLRAGGYAVPAFSVPFVAPDVAVITSPPPTATLALGASDFALTWTGGSGFVDVLFDFYSGNAVCRFDAALGMGTIPMAAFHPGPASYFVIETSNEVKTTLTDWAITTTASVDATWPDGTAAVGTATVTLP